MNANGSTHRKYIVITPAKDESAYIERTIVSMLKQTARPAKWVVVDDGSRDETPRIVGRYAQQYDWIQLVVLRRDAERKPGSAEIRAFYFGFEQVYDLNYDFIVKLDADLELPPDYFERIFAEFDRDASLGIASGVYLEERKGAWMPVEMPAYHAAGASKIIRRACHEEIGGFPLLPGWDTADEIKAQARGWKTKHFPAIQFFHLRAEGLAIGLLRTSASHGRMYYVCGGGPLFLLLKVARRMIHGKPIVVAGMALLWGYVKAALTLTPRLVNASEARSYRTLLKSQVTGRLQRLNPF